MVEFKKNKNSLLEALELSSKEIEELKNKILKFKLEIGEKLNFHDQEIPGVFFIDEGEMRLTSLDVGNEPYTVKKFSRGQLVGAEEILRGCKGQSISASSQTKGSLLPKSIFLELVKNKRQVLNLFSNLTVNELFLSINQNEDAKNINAKELINWAKEKVKIKTKIILLEAGENLIETDSNFWLVSSSNIEGYPPGSIIKSKLKLKVLGSLPGRLIPINFKLPILKNIHEKSPSKDNEYEKEYIAFNRRKIDQQREAFEDNFGKLKNRETFPHTSGNGPLDESLACLRMISQEFDLPFRKDLLRRVINDQLNNSKISHLEINQFAAICELIGLRCSILKPDSLDLVERIPLPSIAMIDQRPVVLWDQISEKILVGDPVNGQSWVDSEIVFNDNPNFSILFVESTANSPKARFGLKWFLPTIKKHKYILIQVVAASFFVQLLGLFNPLLIQQIIDAVIFQGNLKSLNVLGTILISMAIAQAIIGSLRTYLFADTTNRMDITWGAKIIHHLLRLPIGYFSKRAVGEVSSRINELEKIRSFLTGTALTVVLDSIFSIIYIVVMLTYSVKLTFFSLSVIPFFIILTLTISPIIRRQLREKAESSAKVTSHLVESLSGMETVKSQGIELQSEWRWEKLYGRQIQAGFLNTMTSTAAGAASNFLQQVSGLLVIWAGAVIVLEGKMSLGQLIAFRILAGYVTSPLLRLASLWQNFQETIISLERLSDIVDHKEEIEIAGLNLPPIPAIKGNIKYQNLSFRFDDKGPLQLLNINFDVVEGSFIGIVGSSGSGKSTLMKLLTRLYEPTEGSIFIDGQDISKIDLYSLRSQIGLVPQECILFDGSVQENIALTKPDSTIEQIKNVAKIACADEFIGSMRFGYGSSVGERGANLSGGQRQRIAIARMLLSQPKLLILDEATSALDIDTELKVTQNLVNNFKGKTVFFISHRLSSLRFCDQILVLHQGVLEERGTHRELMNLNGRYATLYRQQGSEIK